MTKLKKIVIHSNLVEYFKDLVTGALQNQNVDTDEMAEFYLVHLLSEFHKSEKIQSRCPQTGKEEPWAITYLRAAHLENPEKFQVLKNLGDRSLYFSGVFSPYLESTIVGIDYFISMGGSAYQHIADLLGSGHSNLQFLYQELAEKFSAFVDILSEVSETAGLQKDSDLLKIYEKWLRTGDNRAARTLTKAGICLTSVDTEVKQ